MLLSKFRGFYLQEITQWDKNLGVDVGLEVVVGAATAAVGDKGQGGWEEQPPGLAASASARPADIVNLT